MYTIGGIVFFVGFGINFLACRFLIEERTEEFKDITGWSDFQVENHGVLFCFVNSLSHATIFTVLWIVACLFVGWAGC